MVRTGAERLAEDPGLAGAGQFGLVTNFTGVLGDLRPTTSAFLAAGLRLTALFGPEHGLNGTAQAGESEPATTDPETGLPVFDTYRRQGAGLEALIEESGVEALISTSRTSVRGSTPTSGPCTTAFRRL
ncbi:exo-beta-N-acetylmuramidase NamZ domain-containing protein [Kribbella catacumbae]|uniref:exo-beta-N-acetylmuramidase NamZ domain-containing protein n=1 Tax=Kribbella catacumbae TaxID=460086 RepID=UPI00039E1710|nr:exo-beta-N-acetylmuramidase NamZ domain-containing protein [Kribbella catacumbae]